MVPFDDRREAGRRLAARLAPYAGRGDDLVVLALPRGGIPVAFEVALALGAPLDVFLVRKLGAPGHPEFAIGAIAAGGVRVLSHDVIAQLGISAALLEQVADRERVELERRDQAYHGDHPRPSLDGKIAIVIDDGLATGSTMEAAVSAIRQQGATRVIAAAPVGSPESCRRLRAMADEVVCLETPEPFHAVGLWYRAFEQTTDEEVIRLLRLADERRTIHEVSRAEEDPMTTRMIPRDHWREELDTLSRTQEGWIVRVAVTGPGEKARTEAQDLPLQGVSVDSTAGAAVAVMVGARSGDHLTHEISAPTEIAIDQGESGIVSALRIVSDDGTTTTVAFRSPARPDAADRQS